MIVNPLSTLFETYKNILGPRRASLAIFGGCSCDRVGSYVCGLWLFSHKEYDLAKDV
jgi:hypothetical protein